MAKEKMSIEDLERLLEQEIGELNKLEEQVKSKQKKRTGPGIGGLWNLGNDTDLLDVLEESGNQTKMSVTPKAQGTFVFGRPKTPEIKASKSQAAIDTKSDQAEEQQQNNQRQVLVSVSQSTNVFKEAIRDASKKLQKTSKDVDFVTKNKSQISSIPKKEKEKSPEKLIQKNKKYENVTPRYQEVKISKQIADKENRNNQTKPPPKQDRSPSVENKLTIKEPIVKERRDVTKVSVDNLHLINDGKMDKNKNGKHTRIDHKEPNYSSRNAFVPSRSKSPVSINTQIPEKTAKPEHPSNQQPKTKVREESKDEKPTASRSVSRNKSYSGMRAEYKPESFDLYSRLNEYSNYKESLQNLVQPEKDKNIESQNNLKKEVTKQPMNCPFPREEPPKIEDKTKIKIMQYKEQHAELNRRNTSTSIDLTKVSQPRLKKPAVEIVNQCSFQPMLSKKSMEIIKSRGYDREKLYQSKTPRKGENEDEQEMNHKPKLCEKSKYLDQIKKRQELPRHDMLNKMGQEYSHRKKKAARDREREEETELRSLSFKPNCKERSQDRSLVAPFNADVVDRNQKWAQRREEKLNRLIAEQDRCIEASCSFRPKLEKHHQAVVNNEDDSHYYSSVFVQDGIKNYFTRLEQARKMKKEAQERLENWGRDRSKSIKKPQESGQFLEISQISKFENNFSNNRPEWETPGTLKGGYSSRGSGYASQQQGYSTKKNNRKGTGPQQQDIETTVAILRENLKKIQIHLN